MSGKVLGMDLADDPYIGENDAELFGNPDGEDAGVPLGETSGDDAEEDFANVKGRVLPSPGNPTQSQDGDHRAQGHIPYRTWCRMRASPLHGRTTQAARWSAQYLCLLL